MTGAKERLLHAAYELFSRFGFAGMSTRVLSRQASANNAAVVYHFGSKVGLYVAVLLHAVDVLEEGADQVSVATEAVPPPELSPAIEQAFRLLAREALDRCLPSVLEPRVALRLGPDALRKLSRLTAHHSAAMLAATVARRAVAEPLERLLASRNVVASDAAAPGTLAGMPRTRF